MKDENDIIKFLEDENVSNSVFSFVWEMIETIVQLQIENEKLKKLLDWKKEW
jgi:hypothetical protein